jgi:hypothetical protein
LDAFVILKAFVTLPFIFFIPGFVTFTALKANRIDSLKLSLFETLFLQVLASILISGWIAFTLAEIGCFSLWLLCAILAAYSLAMFLIFRARFTRAPFPRPRWNRQTVFLILLTVVAFSLFFHPWKGISGEWGIGVDISAGASIAYSGSIITHDPILSAMPDSLRDTFYWTAQDGTTGRQFIDIAILDNDSGTVMPIKPHLGPVWLAIFYSIFGLSGTLYSQPLFGLLAVLSVFLAGKTIWNWRVGAIASALLAVNFVQVFFSQYPSPEILFQLLAFGGIAIFVLFMRTHNGFFGIVSAMCFGQLFMARIEAPLVLIPLAGIAVFALLFGEWRKALLYFIVPFLVLWLHSLTHVYYFCMPYLGAQCATIHSAHGIGVTPTLVIGCLLGLSVVVALVTVFTAIYSPKSAKLKTIGRKVAERAYMPRLLTFVVILLIIYLWLTSPAGQVFPWVTNLVLIPRGPIDTTVALSWFVGWFGLGVALFGLFSMLYRRPFAESYLFLGIVSLALVGCLYSLASNPILPWAMRRTIPIVLPAIVIFIGYGVERVRELLTGTISLNSGRALFGKLTMMLLVLALVVPSASMCYTLLRPQFEGFVHQVDEVADFFPDHSIILGSGLSPVGRLPMPLKYIYHKDAIYLWSYPADADKFAEMVRLWNEEGREVYLVSCDQARFDHISRNLSRRIKFEHEATFSIEFSRTPWEWRQFSNQRVDFGYSLEVYRLILP